MKIYRKIQKIFRSPNRNTNGFDNLNCSGVVHFTENGQTTESIYYEETYSHHCGCFAPPGGRCYECGVVSCIKCHRHCGGSENATSMGCGKPLCREHSQYLTVDSGISLPFCKQCYAGIKRAKRNQKITQLLLSPFIEEGNENEQ